jgi:hypothetical protein
MYVSYVCIKTTTDKKAFNEMMERRDAERKASVKKRLAQWKANRKKREAERKAGKEEVAARLVEANHDKRDAKQMRLETKTEYQEKMNDLIVDMKDGQKGRMACQEVMQANPEKTEPNPVEKEAIEEWQENPNKEATNHFLRVCRKE